MWSNGQPDMFFSSKILKVYRSIGPVGLMLWLLQHHKEAGEFKNMIYFMSEFLCPNFRSRLRCEGYFCLQLSWPRGPLSHQLTNKVLTSK